MNINNSINAKEIRTDMIGFLKRLKSGQPLTIIYRSKPYVTVEADPGTRKTTQAADAGTPTAIRRSIVLAKKINQGRRPILDPSKSIKQLYNQTMAKKYGTSRR